MSVYELYLIYSMAAIPWHIQGYTIRTCSKRNYQTIFIVEEEMYVKLQGQSHKLQTVRLWGDRDSVLLCTAVYC